MHKIKSGTISQGGANGTDRHFRDVTISADCDTKEVSVWQNNEPLAYGTAPGLDCSAGLRFGYVGLGQSGPQDGFAQIHPSGSASWGESSSTVTTETTTITSSTTISESLKKIMIEYDLAYKSYEEYSAKVKSVEYTITTDTK